MSDAVLLSMRACLSITDKNFLLNKTGALIKSFSNTSVSGYNVNIKRKFAVLAALGEFIERDNFLSLGNLLRKNSIKGYSIIRKEVVEISVLKINQRNLFIDSCGLASHTSSDKCIIHALCEFIERQSFVFNYLSKSPGKYIETDRIAKAVNYSRYVSEIKFFDISIVEGFFVVIGYGIIDDNFYIGLGSSLTLDQALASCVKELDQFRFHYRSTAHNMEAKGALTSLEDYSDMFFAISTRKKYDAYSYLGKGSNGVTEDEFTASYTDVIKKLHEKYGIAPIICYVNPQGYCSQLKNVKIIDLNWFPSMFPMKFSHDVYDFVESVTNVRLDRECTFIPFP